MSRSYRKPYAAWCGGYRSAADDKRIARRRVRAAQDNALRGVIDWDEALIPHRYECKHNQLYEWARFGKKQLHQTPVLDWDIYRLHSSRYSTSTETELMSRAVERFEDDIKYYRRLKRK